MLLKNKINKHTKKHHQQKNNTSRAVINQNTRKEKSKLGRLTLTKPFLIKRKKQAGCAIWLKQYTCKDLKIYIWENVYMV